MENEPSTKRNWLWIMVIVLLIIIFGFVYYFWKTSGTKKEASDTVSTNKAQQSKWKDKGVAISGNYADADVVNLGDGKYRLYYSIEPEVPGNKLEMYSSTSTDGVNWTKEEGIRKEMSTFPDVIQLPDKTWRMYFQNAGVIKSATSTDGLSWQDEDGTRIDKAEEGFDLENVGAQTTILLPNNTYLMTYRGTINKPYETTEKVPNQNTQLFFYATSTDGLNFTKKGIALESRNDTLFGLADGAELVKWDDGEMRLYFWSYNGVYHLTYANDKFSETPIFDFTNNPDLKIKFAENPPGDPALIKIGDNWFMYYGQHTKGIYYATLE